MMFVLHHCACLLGFLPGYGPHYAVRLIAGMLYAPDKSRRQLVCLRFCANGKRRLRTHFPNKSPTHAAAHEIV